MRRTQDLKDRLLREEAGHRTEVAARAANEVRVEPDLAAVEVEVRRHEKAAIGLRRELVAGTIHVQFLPTDEPFGMSQDDGTDRETSETELVGHEDLTSATDGLAAMAHAELGGDDQDVALLRLGDEIQRVRRASVSPQLRRRDLSLTVVTVVAERPGGRDLDVNELEPPGNTSEPDRSLRESASWPARRPTEWRTILRHHQGSQASS